MSEEWKVGDRFYLHPDSMTEHNSVPELYVLQNINISDGKITHIYYKSSMGTHRYPYKPEKYINIDAEKRALEANIYNLEDRVAYLENFINV